MSILFFAVIRWLSGASLVIVLKPIQAGIDYLMIFKQHFFYGAFLIKICATFRNHQLERSGHICHAYYSTFTSYAVEMVWPLGEW